MSDHSEDLAKEAAQIRDALVLAGYGQPIIKIEAVVELLPRILPQSLNHEIGWIHNLAGRLPCVDRLDYGSMLFEQIAEVTEDPAKKLRFLQEARYRAYWACKDSDDGTRYMENCRRLAAKVAALSPFEGSAVS